MNRRKNLLITPNILYRLNHRDTCLDGVRPDVIRETLSFSLATSGYDVQAEIALWRMCP